jgi:hypothetical protein
MKTRFRVPRSLPFFGKGRVSDETVRVDER